MTGVEQRKPLAQYNSLYKDMDEVYRALARHYGLSDCALWILYSLREADNPLTQNKLCDLFSQKEIAVPLCLNLRLSRPRILPPPQAHTRK